VVVTGGASGIGAACVRNLASLGRGVAIIDRDGDTARSLAAEVNRCVACEAVVAFEADVGAEASVQHAIGAIERECGDFDAVISAAGMQLRLAIEETSSADWQRLIDVNLTSFFHVVKAGLGSLTRAGGASVVAVTSVASFLPQARRPAYVASKAGLAGLVRALAVDLAPLNIRVNAIAPGIVDTPMLYEALAPSRDRDEFARTRARRIPLGRLVSPESVAAAAAFLISDGARDITGVELAIDGGLSAVDEYPPAVR
jgi:NAD(P)-dependent dehydrogenase (short-subunit alcohol dehydrogenase family)